MSVKTYNYGNYSSQNYGSSRAVEIGRLTLYFSYQTVVAFNYKGELVIRENDWGPTTGRHLNCIDSDKRGRLCGEEFKKKLDNVLKECGLD